MDHCWLQYAFAALAATMRSLHAATNKLQLQFCSFKKVQQVGWKVNFGAGRLEKCLAENRMHSHQAVIYFLAFILSKESNSARLQ